MTVCQQSHIRRYWTETKPCTACALCVMSIQFHKTFKSNRNCSFFSGIDCQIYIISFGCLYDYWGGRHKTKGKANGCPPRSPHVVHWTMRWCVRALTTKRLHAPHAVDEPCVNACVRSHARPPAAQQYALMRACAHTHDPMLHNNIVRRVNRCFTPSSPCVVVWPKK